MMVEPIKKEDISKRSRKIIGTYVVKMLNSWEKLEQFIHDSVRTIETDNRARLLDSDRARQLLKNGEPRRAFSEEIQYLAERKYGKYGKRSWKQRLGRDAYLSAETIRKIYTLETLYPQRESIYVILLALGIELVEKAELLFEMSGFSRYTDSEAIVEKIIFDSIKEKMTVDECCGRLRDEGCDSNLTGILKADDAHKSISNRNKKARIRR